jgi:hypothetical protein
MGREERKWGKRKGGREGGKEKHIFSVQKG